MNKDVKKYQEALNTVKNYTERASMHKGSFDLLQKLVDKATPMKVLNFMDYGKDKYGVCPNCKSQSGMNMLNNNDKYCTYCGQALDWSEDNER